MNFDFFLMALLLAANAVLIIQAQGQQKSHVNTSRHCTVRTLRPKAVIAALLQLHENYYSAEDRCSDFLEFDASEQSESFFFALNKIVELNGTVIDWSRLRSTKVYAPQEEIGWVVRDTCSSGILGTMQSLDLATESPLSFAIRQATHPATVNLQKVPNYVATLCEPQLFAIVGPASDEEVAAVSPLLTAYEIPHISFWASSTSFNDVNRYPYLFRTVPAIDRQVTAMVDVLEYFGWKYVALVAAQDDLYSGRAVDLIQHESRRRKFCLGHVLRFSTRNELVMAAVAKQLKRDTKARVIILFAPLTPAKAFLDVMDAENVTEKIIIGSNDWVSRLAFEDKPILHHSLAVIGFSPRRFLQSKSVAWAEEFLTFYKERPDPFIALNWVLANPWLRAFTEKLLQCHFPGRSQCEHLQESVFPTKNSSFRNCKPSDFYRVPSISFLGRAEPLFFSMELAAEATEEVWQRTLSLFPLNRSQSVCFFPRGPLVRNAFRNLKMPCLNNDSLCRVFDEKHQVYPSFSIVHLPPESIRYHLEEVGTWDGRAGKNYSTRLQWIHTPNASFFRNFSSTSFASTWPQSVCSRQCAPGEYRTFYNPQLAVCCWRCDKCPADKISNVTNADSCETCPLGMKPVAMSSRCEEADRLELKYSNGFVSVLLALSSIGGLLVLWTIGVFVFYRSHAVVRSSDFTIAMVILIASLVSHMLSPFTVGTGHLTKEKCQSIYLMLILPKHIVLAAVLVKTNRFVAIFRAASQFRSIKGHRHLFSTPVQLAVIAGIALLGLVLALLHNSTVGTETVYPNQHEQRIICTSSDTWTAIFSTYSLSLVVIVLVLAFMTRKLPENYNEAQQLYFSSLATFVVWAGLTPALFITSSELQPLIITVLAEGHMWAVWLCLFMPRLIHLFWKAPPAKQTSIVPTPTFGNVQMDLRTDSPKLRTPSPHLTQAIAGKDQLV